MESLTCSECANMLGISAVFCALRPVDIVPDTPYCDFFRTPQNMPISGDSNFFKEEKNGNLS